MSKNLENLILEAKRSSWCMDYMCTTCGARPFRSLIKRLFDHKQLIDELKKLTIDFVDDRSNRDAMLILLSDLGYPNYTNLIKELSDSAAGEFLKRAIRIEKERITGHKERMISQQENRKNSQIVRAQANIWGAIKRKDFSAIEHLVAKGVDLEQTNGKGLSLKAALKNIGMDNL